MHTERPPAPVGTPSPGLPEHGGSHSTIYAESTGALAGRYVKAFAFTASSGYRN